MLRFATDADIEAILTMAQANADLLEGYGGCNLAKIRATAADAIGKRLVAVVEDNGTIVGSIGLRAYTPWHGDQALLTNLWIYTVPGQRSFKTWRCLLAVARSIAEELKLPLIFNAEDHKTPERKDRLFGRAGRRLLASWCFVPIGADYLMTERSP